VVATRLGSQDPRDTAQATGWAGAVRPDGAALRATFDDLAARAARTRAESDHASATASTASTAAGFSWRDAGIGGAVTLLAVVLAGFALATVSHRAKTPARI
jgi:hypothetical protein